MKQEVIHTGAIDKARSVEVLQGLVAIPSLSRQEASACMWLVEQMRALGFRRAYVDRAGNAVGEMGPEDASQVIMLLGHIDTVPGKIPVRIEETVKGQLLYGRGSVDAKGPLATFVVAAARAGDTWAAVHGVRVVVVGAVEEEAATSKGARFVRDQFDGAHNPIPAVCVIGEPSGWPRVTMGYKGRLLVEVRATQPVMHTAGPDAGVAVIGVDLWNWVTAYAARFNDEIERNFDHLMPSLRRIRSESTDGMEDAVDLQIGIRLPPDFDVQAFAGEMVGWLSVRMGGSVPTFGPFEDATALSIEISGEPASAKISFSGYEKTWRSERDPLLVRSFLAAIRTVSPNEKVGFVVKTGTSDMNVVAPFWRCPIVAYGPGDSSLDHTPHEHLSVDEYWLAVQVLEETLRNVASMLSAGKQPSAEDV